MVWGGGGARHLAVMKKGTRQPIYKILIYVQCA